MDITIYDGIENMDFNKVTEMLSEAIWSKGIKEDEIKQGAVNSALVIGAFCNNVQVGYARVISDKTRFAYIADVYVDENYRHHGIAKNMMLHILSHESLKDVYQWLLRSAASELYEKVGFVPVSEPERWMEIRQNRRER
jgi:predicted acetyltransferase